MLKERGADPAGRREAARQAASGMPSDWTPVPPLSLQAGAEPAPGLSSDGEQGRSADRQKDHDRFQSGGLMGAAAGSSAGAAAAAMIQATRASGVLVRLEPRDFQELVRRQPDPLVVHATGGVFRTHHQYLIPYRGLAFYTKSGTPMDLPRGAEVVEAARIWMPG